MDSNDGIKIKRLNINDINPNEELINFKIILVGDSSVGKTCLLMRAVNNRFTENYQATIGFEFLLMYYQVNNAKIKLQIWDTCGQEIYRSLIQGFYRNTSATLIVFSKSDRKTFNNLNSWVKDVKNNTEQEIPIFLIGNKCDVEKNSIQVTREEGEEYMKQYNLKYYSDVSAKTGYNVLETFEELAKTVYKDYCLKNNPRQKINKMTLDKKEDNLELKPKKSCC